MVRDWEGCNGPWRLPQHRLVKKLLELSSLRVRSRARTRHPAGSQLSPHRAQCQVRREGQRQGPEPCSPIPGHPCLTFPACPHLSHWMPVCLLSIYLRRSWPSARLPDLCPPGSLISLPTGIGLFDSFSPSLFVFWVCSSVEGERGGRK